MAPLGVDAMLDNTAQHVACMQQSNCPQVKILKAVLYVHDCNEVGGLSR